MAQLSASSLRDDSTPLPNHPGKKLALPENKAGTLEQFVHDMGLSATLRGLADLANQWSKQDLEHRAHWEQICLAIHTCAGVRVEPLLDNMNEKPEPFLCWDSSGVQAVVHARTPRMTEEAFRHAKP
jgi:hypothetical protein